MNTIDAIRRMCDESGKSTTQVSTEIGRTRSFVGSTLTRQSVPRANTLALIAQACGYRLVLESDTDRIQIDPD